jgi:hypothetical protein
VPDFKYGFVMIDNSKTEKAAVRQLWVTGDAKGYLLCYFHFLQDWERFLISKEAGVSKEEKNAIMVELAELMHCRSKQLFLKKVGGHSPATCCARHRIHPRPPLHSPTHNCSLLPPTACRTRPRQVTEFCTKHRLRRKVVAHMKKDWLPEAEQWACWGTGRQDPGVAAMLSDTNNLAESGFRLIKYTDLNRNAQSSCQQLVDTLLTKTTARCMQQRAHQLVGRASSDQVARAERMKQVVLGLAGEVEASAVDSSIGRAAVGGSLVYLGDLSCSCSYNGAKGGSGEEGARRQWWTWLGHDVVHTSKSGRHPHHTPPHQPTPAASHMCVHVKAAAQAMTFTHGMRLATAAHLLAGGSIEVGEGGFCTCPALADLSRSHTFRPAEGFCTCNDCTEHGTCCHLLAAPLLEAFQGVELMTGVPLQPGQEGQVRSVTQVLGGAIVRQQ